MFYFLNADSADWLYQTRVVSDLNFLMERGFC